MIPLPCHWSARPQLAYLSDNRMENDFMDGSFLIGARAVTRDDTFRAIDPATNEALDPAFATSSLDDVAEACRLAADAFDTYRETDPERSEEHTSELQSLMRTSYAVFCLTKNKNNEQSSTLQKATDH